jgi:hypothetical protein
VTPILLLEWKIKTCLISALAFGASLFAAQFCGVLGC